MFKYHLFYRIIMSELTCIQISKETRTRLKSMGTLGDTYESLILRLLENWEGKNGRETSEKA